MPESLCADYSPRVIREAEAQIIKLLLPPLLLLPLLHLGNTGTATTRELNILFINTGFLRLCG